jgi:F-type H+-transporting ATPase subunit a
MAASSASEYIKHHLGNLTYGRLPEGYERLDHHGDVVETLETSTWTFAHNGQEAVDMGFMAFHVDSLAWAGGLGIIMCALRFHEFHGIHHRIRRQPGA